MNKFTVSSFLIGLPRNDGRLGDAALPFCLARTADVVRNPLTAVSRKLLFSLQYVALRHFLKILYRLALPALVLAQFARHQFRHPWRGSDAGSCAKQECTGSAREYIFHRTSHFLAGG